ncbi:hypothetical protein CL629_02335 [bacterium]|nr:hypothetical protein [bacterium]|tara:strand:- start:211 stop:1140 length:930 start_codon:yes stop_codon:yes gene_type:complete
MNVRTQNFFNPDLQTSWSGIKTLNAPTARDALRASGLDWNVVNKPLFLEGGREVPKARAIVREDNGVVLGVVGKQYQPIQNKDGLAFFDDVSSQFDDMRYVSAGSIAGGRRVWLLADFGGFDAQSGDEIRKQILLFNSHDGSSTMSYVFCPMRITCNNQIAVTLTRDKFLKIRHSQDAMVRFNDARKVASHAVKNYDSIKQVYKTLVQTSLTDELISGSLEALFPIEEAEGRTLTRRSNTRREITRLLSEGKGSEQPKTAFSLYNAFSEYYTHHTQANTENGKERRWSNNLFGKGAKNMNVVTKVLLAG